MATYASYSNFASAQPYGNGLTASYNGTASYGGMPLSFAQPSSSYAAPSGIMSSSYAPPSGIMSMNNFGTTMMAPMIQQAPMVQAPQMVEYVQQPMAPQYEIRELAEDRIIRRPAVYKTAAPVFVEEAAQYLAAPAQYLAAPVAILEAAPVEVYIQPEQDVQAAEDDAQQLIEALNQTLGNLTRVCILGGTAFKDEATEPLVNALADAFTAWLSDKVVVVTGGMKGVQETFANGCAQGCAVVNMLPADQASNFGVGVDFAAFRDLNERIEYFGQIGDIYITIEGGPGVSKEANAAFSRGAIVLPMMSTGGASNGMFDFPAGALEVQPFATPEHWDLLQTKGKPEETARAVCEIILGLLPQPEEEQQQQ